MQLRSIEESVAALPADFEPLLLSFFRGPFEVVEGAAVIGSDEANEFRVELATGRVWSVAPMGEGPTRFVNSGVGQLAQSIRAYAEYAAEVRTVDDEDDAVSLVHGLRDRMGLIDPAAIADPRAWWSVILEQAEDGLL